MRLGGSFEMARLSPVLRKDIKRAYLNHETQADDYQVEHAFRHY